MATNLQLDDRLVDEAKRAGRHRTKREAVDQALREYVSRHKQRAVLELFGKLDWDPGYDYKATRHKR